MIKNTFTNKKGFTLIETLVAISILMIAIAGPLTVAHKGYTSAIDAKNQSVAINLAQEGMEYLNFVKDNKIWGDWVQGTAFDETVDQAYLGCTISSPICNSLPNGGALNTIPNGFQRSFYFTPQNTDQVLAVVVVTWNTALLQGRIQLSQVFTNYER
jgi:prepilin-type N-terminal cleavage/methylation domain-containing protein